MTNHTYSPQEILAVIEKASIIVERDHPGLLTVWLSINEEARKRSENNGLRLRVGRAFAAAVAEMNSH